MVLIDETTTADRKDLKYQMARPSSWTPQCAKFDLIDRIISIVLLLPLSPSTGQKFLVVFGSVCV